MWLRSILVGFSFALVVGALLTEEAFLWLLGTHESYFFGSLVDDFFSTVMLSSAVTTVLHLVVASLMIIVLTVVGALFWHVTERSVVGLAEALDKFRLRAFKH